MQMFLISDNIDTYTGMRLAGVRIKFLIHGISDVIDKMTENVEFADRG